MAKWRRFSLAAALALATWLATGGLLGCGGGNGAVVAKADAVVVTYYYLPL